MIDQEKKIQKIKTILKLQNAQEQYVLSLNFGINLLRQTYPDINDEFFSSLISEFNENKYESLIVQLYNEMFIDVELDSIMRFLSSNTGRKLFGKVFLDKQKVIGSNWGMVMERKCLAEQTMIDMGEKDDI